MPWRQLRWPAKPEHVERLSDALEACGAIAISVSGDEDEHRLQAATEDTAWWSINTVSGLVAMDVDMATFTTCVRAQLDFALAEPLAQILSDEDWSESWKANYHPLRVTDGLWICPSWIAPPNPRAVNIILDPGLAFGTGDHATTFLCLEWLASQPLHGKTVVDFGCGSGILAIAALKLGAAHAWAVDIDAQAIGVTRENAARNSVQDRLTVGRPDDLPSGFTADVVVANILASPLVSLAPVLTALVSRPNGRLALSGLLEEQEAMVRPAYRDRVQLHSAIRGGWVRLSGARIS